MESLGEIIETAMKEEEAMMMKMITNILEIAFWELGMDCVM